jgi:hypothetical protein
MVTAQACEKGLRPREPGTAAEGFAAQSCKVGIVLTLVWNASEATTCITQIYAPPIILSSTHQCWPTHVDSPLAYGIANTGHSASFLGLIACL